VADLELARQRAHRYDLRTEADDAITVSGHLEAAAYEAFHER